ncbi:hypothetical protein LZ32DRAFT_647598 [Colletotrichum eremochloae]|nr:hypothetical protein LZ32DRAFT_647598 [Colletotrichum eremochloae]
MSGFEVIGAVTAAGQFLEQGHKIVRFISAVVSQVADGQDQIKAWLEELETLNGIVEQIRSNAKLHSAETEKVLVRCKGHAGKLEVQLRSLSFNPEESTLKKTWRAICTLEQEKSIMDIIQSLEREKQSLNSLLSLALTSMTEAGFSSVEAKLDAMALHSPPPGSDEERCLRALFLTDPIADRAGLVTKKGRLVDGTCDWVVKTKEFISWRQEEGGLLWITGRPGQGKTMLSIFLTTYLEEWAIQFSERGLELTTYFFCDNRDSRKNHPTAILRGLLTLLLKRMPRLITYILPSYRVQGVNLFEQSSFESLWNIFIDMVNHSGLQRVSCIIDGLDECEPVADLEAFLTKIESVPRTAPRVGMIIASRGYPKCLSVALGQAPRIRLDTDHENEVRADLEAYIARNVEELRSKATYNFPDALVGRIKHTLRERSEGTFIWVSFVVKELRNKEAAEVENCLEELPKGLDNMYARMLSQVDNSRRDKVRNILCWCTFAQRPLELWELAAALEIEAPATGTLHAIDVARSYVAYCGSFVTLVKNKGSGWPSKYPKYYPDQISASQPKQTSFIPRTKRDTDVLELVHQSAKDFLIKMPLMQTTGLNTWMNPLDPEQEQSELASKCLRCLQKTSLWADNNRHYLKQVRTDKQSYFGQIDSLWRASKRELKKHGLLFYASEFWHEHLRNVRNPAEQNRVVQQHHDFFRKDSPARETWMEYGLYSSSSTFYQLSKEGTLLEVACYLGLDFLLPPLSRRRKLLGWAPLRLKNYLKPSLALAIAKGHVEIVKYLVKRGTEVNGREEANGFRGANYRLDIQASWTPLWLACKYAHLEMTQLLLKAGAKVNDPGHPEPPLHMAASLFKQELIVLLIACGADVEATDELGDTVFHRLVTLRQRQRESLALLETLQIILRSPHGPVAARIPNRQGKTLFHLVAEYGFSDMLKELLEPRWKLSDLCTSKGEFGYTPLHEAWSTDVVRMLLAVKGVDPNAQDDKGRTLLHRMAEYETDADDNAVQVFLSHAGVTVDARDFEDKTPLHLASYWGLYKNVKLLLQDGKADINSRSSEQQTPLHALIQGVADSSLPGYPGHGSNDWGKTMLTLLEAGADVSLEDSAGRKPSDLITKIEGRGDFPKRRLDPDSLDEFLKDEALGPELSRWRRKDRWTETEYEASSYEQ